MSKIKQLTEDLTKIIEAEDAEEYKEYTFFFAKDSEGNVIIDAEDYDGQYREWQNEGDEEEMENVIDIAKDEQIKNDIEKLEGKSIEYIDITDFEYDESDRSGAFTLGVTFDVSSDEYLEPQVNSVGDIVAENAEAAMKSMAVVLDYIEDPELIAKLEEAADLLRQMVPHLQ